MSVQDQARFSEAGLFYAGIGSRRTPEPVLKLMEKIAVKLRAEGWVLRSGHAPGADQAFERGADGQAQIFLPWPNFEQPPRVLGQRFGEPIPRAFEIAAEYHPAWDRCSQGARRLHARNSQQILGPRLNDQVGFVVCWSDGKGGTEQALRIALDHRIPITNLYVADSFAWASEWANS
jgi:hypothetical protein